MAANANIVISAVDNASRVLSGVGKAAGSMGGALSKSLSVASDLTIATAGMVKVMQGLGKAIAVPLQLSIEQERVEGQLAAVLKSTGHAAGLNAKELKSMASGLQEVTTFGDEAIIGAENILLTFKQIGGEGGIFQRTTEAVLDVATAMGMDLKSASVQVGKALNDPATGLSMLTRVGITFSEEQKNVIKGLQAAGDMAGAQAVILAELEEQFGGSAKAAAETFGGSLTQLKNTWGDLLETAGSFITQNEGVKALIHELSAGVKEWTEGIEDLSSSQEGQVKVAELMQSALIGVLQASQAMVTGFGFLGGVIFDVVTYVAELRGEIVPLTGEQRELADAIADVEQKLAGMDGTIQAVTLAGYDNADAIKQQEEYAASLQEELIGLQKSYKEATDRGGDFSTQTDAANDRIQTLIDRLQEVDVEAVVVESAVEDLAEEFGELAKQVDWANLALRELAPESKASGKEMQEQRERVLDLLGDMRSAPSAFDSWSASWSQLRLELVGLPWEEQTARLKAFGDTMEAQAKFAKEFKPLPAAEIAEGAEGLEKGTEAAAELGVELEGNNEKMREFAEEIARADEAWERSIESMANRSADSFSQVFENWATGQESLGDGFEEFGQKAKSTLADAFMSPILGAEGPLQQLFEGALKPVSQLGKAIGEKIFGTMISGIASYFVKKKAVEAADSIATVGAQATAASGILGVQQASVMAMMPGLSAAASAALIATFGGAAAAASLLPGILTSSAAAGKATATALAAVPFAEGGYVTEPTYAVAGEAGTELILPLTKPQRARELLDELPGRAPGLLPGGKTIVNNVTVEINMSGSSATPEAVAEVVNEVLGAKLGLT